MMGSVTTDNDASDGRKTNTHLRIKLCPLVLRVTGTTRHNLSLSSGFTFFSGTVSFELLILLPAASHNPAKGPSGLEVTV